MYVKGALLMISLTSINTVYILQSDHKKKWLLLFVTLMRLKNIENTQQDLILKACFFQAW